MAVWAVVEMDVDWYATGDEYFMRFTARDGTQMAISVAGSIFDSHGPAIRKAMHKRAAAHRPVAHINGEPH